MRKEIAPKDIRQITGLKDYERETNILFNAEDNFAEVCTTDYEVLKAMQAVAKKNKELVKVYKISPLNNPDRIDCYIFTVPKTEIKILEVVLKSS